MTKAELSSLIETMKGRFLFKYGLRCTYCCTPYEEWQYNRPSSPTVDHIVAVASGGSNEPGNLTICCHSCNMRKGDRGLAAFFEDIGIDVPDFPTLADVLQENPDNTARFSTAERVQVIAPETWIARVDDWRSQQRPLPSRSEAIRLLVEDALKSKEK